MSWQGKRKEKGKIFSNKKKKKKKARSTATATGENVIKINAGSLRNYGYFGSGKLQIGTLMLTPPLKYFGLTKSSH